MPIKRCKLPNGKLGWQYGNQKCYESREDALKQMRAIKYSETHGSEPSVEDIQGFLEDLRKGNKDGECCS
jgi:hypothetical protein